MTNAQANIEYAAQDAHNAKSDFYNYCASVPGAHAATVLANMKATPEHSKRYWNRALSCARLAHAAWCAA